MTETIMNENFISQNDLENFKASFAKEIEDYFEDKLKKSNEELLNQIAKMIEDRLNNSSEESSTEYDLDNDVIMKNKLNPPVRQVPEPGFFNGDTTQTELFCELCYDTFKTYPNNQLEEEAKINFVKSRLRDSARIWYRFKYKDDNSPATMVELLQELAAAFTNVISIKLSKIQLIELRQNYGKINEYIEKFRSLSRLLQIDNSSLSLLFLNGLHPKYKEEVVKADTLPDTLEAMITKCILIENTLIVNNKIKSNSKSNQKTKKDSNNESFIEGKNITSEQHDDTKNTNDRNHNNNGYSNYKYNKKKSFNNGNHNYSNQVIKTTKINSRN